MTKTARNILIGIAVIIPLGIIALIAYGMSIWKNISIKPYFVSADLSGLSLADIPAILTGGQRQVKTVLGMEVLNDSDVDISFSSLKATLYYEGNKIGETSDKLKNTKYVASAHNLLNPLRVSDEVTLTLNQSVAKLLVDKISGKKPKVDYEIQLTILGIPFFKWFPIKSNFEW